jgi:hypothetical protein
MGNTPGEAISDGSPFQIVVFAGGAHAEDKVTAPGETKRKQHELLVDKL